MSKIGTPSELAETSRSIFIGLLIYMPLHILLSTWIGSSFNLLGAAKVAKDGVMLMGFLTAVAAAYRLPWFKQFLKNRLVWLIVAFGALNVLLALLKATDQDAETLGVVYNTRFFVFFLYGLLLTKLFEPKALLEKALKAVLLTSVFVLFFGILQYTFLPDRALSHLGYSRRHGVLPAFYIDDKRDLERVMSTLRDPNSLGSYIIIIGSIAFAALAKSRIKQQRKAATGLLILSSLCLLFTFSRSAWLGFVLAIAIIIGISARQIRPSPAVKQKLLAGLAGVVLIAGIGLFMTRNTYLIKNVIFHADESTVLENPNELRTRFWRESVDEVVDEPLGHGPGTAGLTSIRNQKQGVNLTENYYLQMAHELGVVGLVIFLAILGIVGLALFRLAPSNTLALGMLAGFVGLALTNFLVHIWANEAVAYTWWGIAGLLLGSTDFSADSSPKKVVSKKPARKN